MIKWAKPQVSLTILRLVFIQLKSRTLTDALMLLRMLPSKQLISRSARISHLIILVWQVMGLSPLTYSQEVRLIHISLETDPSQTTTHSRVFPLAIILYRFKIIMDVASH